MTSYGETDNLLVTSPTCRQLGIQHVNIVQQQQQLQAATTTNDSSTTGSVHQENHRHQSETTTADMTSLTHLEWVSRILTRKLHGDDNLSSSPSISAQVVLIPIPSP